jgi:3-deoxy-manno-octulosonate cytidylyltransferase (CMP-KDO synthetase)
MVVNLQCDQPFVPREVVRGAIGRVEAGFPVGSAAVSLAAGDQENPNRVKVVVQSGGRAVSFTRSPQYAIGGESGYRVLHHVGVYAYTRAALLSWAASPECAAERVERLEQLRPLRQGVPIGVACFDIPAPLAIDTREDLRQASSGFVGPELQSPSRMSA